MPPAPSPGVASSKTSPKVAYGEKDESEIGIGEDLL